MKKLNIFTLILCMTLNAFAGMTITDRLKLRANGDIQFEGATNNNFETTVVVVDPNQDNTITLQDASGTLAFLTDLGAGVFGPTGVLHVDAGNVADGLEDGSIQHPFDVIAEAITASIVGNLIKVAPGTYAETLVIPHDLHFNGPHAHGVTSIDISSGRIQGRLGKIEWYANGAIIYPESATASVDNGNCILLAIATGQTQSTTRFSVGAIGGAIYDFGSQFINLTAGSNGELIDLFGIGVDRAFFTTTASAMIRVKQLTNIDNIQGTAATIFIENINTDWIGRLTHVKTNKRIVLSTSASAAFNGEAESVICDNLRIQGTLTANNGRLTSISTTGSVQIANFGGYAAFDDIRDILLTSLDADGVIDVRNIKNQFRIETPTPSDVLGVILGGATGAINDVITTQDLGGLYNGFIINGNTPSFQAHRLDESFIMMHSSLREFGGGLISGTNHTLIDGARFEYVRFSLTQIGGNSDKFATTENSGVFDHVIFEKLLGGANEIRIPVSTGAIFNNVVFNNWITGSSDPLDAAIAGRDLLHFYGLVTANSSLWDDSEQKLVFAFNVRPQESDGAGGYQDIATVSPFNATIYKVPATGAGDDISAVVGLLINGEIFEDLDTTPADGVTDTHGFPTTTGVSVFVFRSTASSATAIDNALSNPGADLSPDGGANEARIGMAATITINDCTLNGLLIGQELTVLGNPVATKSVLLIADDTVINMNGFDKLKLDSDNATATNRTMSFDLTSLIVDQIYTVYFIDATFAAEWIDGGADSAKLAGTMTFGEDDTIRFIYDGTTIRELARSVN